MKTIRILLILILITSQSALAFEKKIDTVVINNDTCNVLQIIVTIDNTDSEALWLWLDSNDYGQDYHKAIRRYLMKRNGDFSIYDIGIESEMYGEWWNPSAPQYCFVKYLNSGNTFTIVFYKEIAPTIDYDVYKDIINDIKIFSNQQIKETCPGIEEPYSVNRISFPHNVIVFRIPN